MVGVLIEMRAAIMRRSLPRKHGYLGGLLLALFVTLLAAGTLAAGLEHYRYAGAGANVVATLCFGWLLGWVSGPLLIGDDAALRMDYFKLLPIPARKLAYAMLGAAFANVSLAFSLIAFAALIALGAQSGAAAALVGAVAVVLDLVLAVVASKVAIAVFGPVISSRRGRDFGTMALALVITLVSVASSLVPFVAARLTDGHSRVLSDAVRFLPSGWGAVAVDAAGRSDWGLTAASLGGLAALTAVLVLAWPPLRLYSRSVLRSMMLMISFLVGVLAGVIGAFSGKTTGLPFSGLLFTLIAAACFTNCYGDDGTSLWLTLVVPGAARADVRGRAWAWFLVVGPAGLLLTLVLTAVSGQGWAWPWVLAAEPAMAIGCAGLLVLTGAWSVNGPAPDGGPSPARVLKTHVALIAVPAVVLFPAAALLIPGAIGHSLLLRWLAVPVAIAWAAFLCWRSVRAAAARLDTRGPEIFARVRTAGL